MLYLSKLTDDDVITFILQIIKSEIKKTEYNIPPANIHNNVEILSRDKDLVVVASHISVGLCKYNIFTLTNDSCQSVYPTYVEDYSEVWRQYINKVLKRKKHNNQEQEMEF